MAATIEDTVLDFDLNFLHQTNNALVQSKIDKQHKAIIIAKRKIIATDSLIKKYYDKKETLDLTERSFISSKEESKQICLEHKTNLDKISNLEKSIQVMQSQNKELETKCSALENKFGAINSHANQLQTLVKEYETSIESLKIEHQLEKSNYKDHDKKVLLLQKENELLLSHLCLVKDIVLRKVQLKEQHKSILKKYGKSGDNSKLDELSDKENDIFEDHIMISSHHDSPSHDVVGTEINSSQKSISIFDEVPIKHNSKGINNDSDSDCSNEIVSVDTGRGSSLAFSDPEKCFNSPECYMNDSPLTSESKLIVLKVSRSTSPIGSVHLSPNAEHSKITRALTENKVLIDKGVSPIMWAKPVDATTSPIRSLNREIATSPIQPFLGKGSEENKQKNVQHKELVDFTFIDPELYDDNSNDCEVERILDTMRFGQGLITPMPKTPSKSRTDSNCSPCRLAREHAKGYVCQESAKLREDYKKLQSSMTDLVNEVMNIKSFLNKTSKNKTVDNFINNEVFVKVADNDPTPRRRSLNNVKNTLPCDKNMLVPQIILERVISPVHDTVLFNDEPLAKQTNYENVEESTETVSSAHAQPLNLMSRIVFEEPLPSENIQNVDLNREASIDPEPLHEELTYDTTEIKKSKIPRKKLSKLEKIRKTLLPKSKISRLQPLRKLRRKKLASKKTEVSHTVKKSTDADTAKTLNDKAVYQKAVKVMAEIKSKKNHSTYALTCADNAIKSTNIFGEHLKNSEKMKQNPSLESCEKESTLLKSPQAYDCVVRITRSQTKHVEVAGENLSAITKGTDIKVQEKQDSKSVILADRKRKHSKSISDPSEEISYKRTLRSSTVRKEDDSRLIFAKENENNENTQKYVNRYKTKSMIIKNGDSNVPNPKPEVINCERFNNESGTENPKIGLFCKMIDKYGQTNMKYFSKRVPESVANNFSNKLEGGIKFIMELQPNKTKEAMNKLLNEVQEWPPKNFVAGLIQYLMNPQRKRELFNLVNLPPAPPMTKSEQALLYLISQLKIVWPSVDIVEMILSNIEYALFKLNKTPDFGVVESMSHFYAVLCRFYQAKSRLRLFIVDAMYCIQFKSVPLIKQCIDVWMHILPLAHMNIAKSSLVTCLVYLMHFYKCEDKFNRVQEIRNLLSKKYFYDLSEWTETKVLEMFKNAVRELKETPGEKKMLRLALIIIAKRHGPKWCQNNIIKKLLQPVIEDVTVPIRIRNFCVLMIGPLLKPYPNEMKVHCEVAINQLIDLLDKKSSEGMSEAIYSSLIYMSKHNLNRVLEVLLLWKTDQVSPELESVLRDFVREKPIKSWKAILSKISSCNE